MQTNSHFMLDWSVPLIAGLLLLLVLAAGTSIFIAARRKSGAAGVLAFTGLGLFCCLLAVASFLFLGYLSVYRSVTHTNGIPVPGQLHVSQLPHEFGQPIRQPDGTEALPQLAPPSASTSTFETYEPQSPTVYPSPISATPAEMFWSFRWRKLLLLSALFVAVAVVTIGSVVVGRRTSGIGAAIILLGGLAALSILVLVFGTWIFFARERSAAVPGQMDAVQKAVYETYTHREVQPSGTEAVPQSQPPAQRVDQYPDRPADPPVTIEAPKPTDVPAAAAGAHVPEWVAKGEVTEGNKRLVVVSSQQFATIQEAEADGMRRARDILLRDLQTAYKYSIPPDESIIDSITLNRHCIETITRQAGANQFRVYRFHAQLETGPQVRARLEPRWRAQISEERLRGLGSVVGFLTMLFATVAAYFRIDGRTGGMYRGRLKLATLSLILAGGLIVGWAFMV